ncbi:hypothetical protein F5Y19DRAFT_479438 [Xylariaceae sp. FL1651]|nr:hypothetical protein F5Y19DRAFT_479438 [Xylariaceae sp. FL1651]
MNADGVAATLSASLVIKIVLIAPEAAETRHILPGRDPEVENNDNIGHALVGAFALVYVGLAIVIKRLPEAELILAMNEDGKIVEQGTFSDLNVTGRYVHSLKINFLQSATSEVDKIEPAPERSTETKVAPTAAQINDPGRQPGDWKTYKYYTAALAHLGLLLFMPLVTVNGVANGIQSLS